MQKQSSGNVSELFSRILTRHLKELNNGKILQDSDLEEIITIEELINWEVWSSMLKGIINIKHKQLRNNEGKSYTKLERCMEFGNRWRSPWCPNSHNNYILTTGCIIILNYDSSLPESD